jgi:hypothetical protein
MAMEHDWVIDEVVATCRAVDSTALLDPKLVHCLVQAVLSGIDEKQAREKRRRADARIGETDDNGEREGY